MRQLNPMFQAGLLSEDPAISQVKRDGYIRRGEEARTALKKYRLYHGDKPAGMVIECFPMEANAWNKNAAAFYAWQASMGRTNLPIMEWKREHDASINPMWRVRFKENGQEKVREIYGSTAAEARREFESVSSVTARIISITKEEEA